MEERQVNLKTSCSNFRIHRFSFSLLIQGFHTFKIFLFCFGKNNITSLFPVSEPDLISEVFWDCSSQKPCVWTDYNWNTNVSLNIQIIISFNGKHACIFQWYLHLNVMILVQVRSTVYFIHSWPVCVKNEYTRLQWFVL